MRVAVRAPAVAAAKANGKAEDRDEAKADSKGRARMYKSLEESLAAIGTVDSELDPVARKACTADFEFFVPLGPPRRGDWLAQHKERGQTFNTYARRMKPPMSPSKSTDTVLLVPMGSSFSQGVAEQFLPFLLRHCASFFSGMRVDLVPQPLSLRSISHRLNDFGHKQYLIGDLFEMLHKETCRHRTAFCRLGITMEDIYPGDEWNYVYGQAKPMERVGVFSFARHSPLFYRGVHASDAGILLTRLQRMTWLRLCIRTMVHETCHMFGILHCVYFQCIMNGNNGPGDSAGRSSFMCPVCLRKILHALSFSPGFRGALTRYSAILESWCCISAEFDNDATEDEGEQGTPVQADIAWLERRLRHLCVEPPPGAALGRGNAQAVARTCRGGVQGVAEAPRQAEEK